MRISQKIIITVITAITIASLSDYYKVQSSIELRNLFDELIESETPALTSLIEIKSSARQASLKAIEYSIRGNLKDKEKTLEAIEKIKLHVSTYSNIEHQDHRSSKTDIEKLNTLVNSFIQTTENYLKLSTGPSLSQLTFDESEVHQSRKIIIQKIKSIDNSKQKLLLEKIRSEARKTSLKSVEFYLRGIQKDKEKALNSITKLNNLAIKFKKATQNDMNSREISSLITTYTDSAKKYLNDISQRKAPVNKIFAYESKLNKSRRSLIHELYNFIEIEKNELLVASDYAKNSVDSLVNIVIFAAITLSLTLIFAGVMLRRAISIPISHLIDATKHIGSGNLESRINISSNDEIKELADSFNIMAEKLASSQDNHKRTLATLIESEQDLSITLNSIGDAVITTDATGHISRMNPVAEKLTGWSSEEAKGQLLKKIFPIINASTREPINSPIDKVMSTGEIIYLSNHTTLISRDGTEYHIADSAAPIRNSDNKILGMVLVFNDVTEQYNLRQVASESKKNLQSIMDNSPAVIYVKDIEGHFTFVNKKFNELFKIQSDKVIGHSLHDIFPQDVADEMKKNDIDVLETGHSLESEEIVPQNGELHTFISTKFPLRDKENKIYAICGISSDITDKKLKDEQLRRSQKMDALGKLTGGIAHDFNNMLGVILGYSELLSQITKGDEKLGGYIHEIHKAGERGANLTKKLLSFSRQKVADSKVHDINKLLTEQKHMLEKTLTARIKLKTELADKLWSVLLDSGDLEDAIVNMCINAMHAIDGNGQLTIRTYNESVNEADAKHLQIEAGDYVLLSITDTGKGMDQMTKERIFDPFFSTKGEQGTGLGLSQVYGFVENSNGTIKVYSEPGHGTRLTLYFPRKIEENIIENLTKQADDNNQNLHGTENILIVDDEPALLMLTSKVLEASGYNIFSAANGKRALEILKEEPIDLMLSDVIMPEMDGYQLAEIVLKDYPKVKIQMASGFSDDRHEKMIDESLHKNLLHKPYHSKTLLKRLRELLD